MKKNGNVEVDKLVECTPFYRNPDRFHLRLLLLDRVSMRSFESLRTVDDVTHDSFGDAARALHLLQDHIHFTACLEETAQFGMPAERWSVFTYVLAFCRIADPQAMLDRFIAAIDYVYQEQSLVEAGASAYFDLLDDLLLLQCDIRSSIRPLMKGRPRQIVEHLDPHHHECEGQQLYSQLNDDQRAAADDIRLSSTSNNSRLHFIDGHGGCDKTFLYNALYHICKGRRYQMDGMFGVAGGRSEIVRCKVTC
uniref:ATP-dependent DNA helicase n=1 Tax=Nippostrongylus brasiliensis TaxID=27835 RepID=A0A0N4XVF4_NIPBR